MDDEYMEENYTFIKETMINNRLESSLNFEFNSKNHITEVLDSMLQFLRASGYEYVDKLVAIKIDGEEVANDDDISEEMVEILSRVVEELDASKTKKKPNLEVVSINDFDKKPPDNT